MNYQAILSTWLMYFYAYSFVGWVWESCYVSFLHKKWTNRGFIRGPLLPLYGSGALVMLLISQPFYENLVLLYLVGSLSATLLEYLTGAAMEALFKVRYWDYSNQRFNLHGYICLSSSLAWGLFTVLLTRYLHVWVSSALAQIPAYIVVPALIVITILFSIDFVIAFKNALQLRVLLEKIAAVRADVVAFSDRMEAALSNNLSQAKTALAEGIEENRYLKEFSERRAALKASIKRYRKSFSDIDRSSLGQQLSSFLSILEKFPSGLRTLTDVVSGPFSELTLPEHLSQWKSQFAKIASTMTKRQRDSIKNHSHIVSRLYEAELDLLKLKITKDDEDKSTVNDKEN